MTRTNVGLYLAVAFGVYCLIREQCASRVFAILAALLWPLLLVWAVLRFIFYRERWF